MVERSERRQLKTFPKASSSAVPKGQDIVGMAIPSHIQLDLNPERMRLRADIKRELDLQPRLSNAVLAMHVGAPPNRVKNERLVMRAVGEIKGTRTSSKARESRRKDRQIALMHYLRYSAAEIAEKLDMTVPAVKSRMQKMALKSKAQITDEQIINLLDRDFTNKEIGQIIGMGMRGVERRVAKLKRVGRVKDDERKSLETQ